MKNKTTNERLAVCETILTEVKNGLDNHLNHHFWINITLLGAVVTEAVAFLILVVKHVFGS